ncbi:MAG: hypothetical protein IJ400_04765 [Clostridia bacterium]|nr:hypothetical protein [Clostridia bacterium]
MFKLLGKCIEVTIEESKGVISSLKIGNIERIEAQCPIFVARLRDLDGKCYYIDSMQALNVCVKGNDIAYSGFDKAFFQLCVKINAIASEGIFWQIEVTGVPENYALEWVELPKICMPSLIDNNQKGGRILFPYNEGIILTDEKSLPRYEPEFPSSGAYFTFPNMVCSQFMAYLFEDIGLYIGAHDPHRALKGVDFYPYENGVAMQMRLYSGANYGQGFATDYPIAWQVCDSNWKSPAEIYRNWLECNPTEGMVPISKNKALPEWYKESPLVVTYPVRGIHDMDKMEPNALFPYTNALPILDKIKNATQCRIMALLMHWEGTVPWAPPYVWPPFGGEALFNEFKDKLHANGDLLGVYCSGFGYTKQSTLIESYNCEEKIKNENVLVGVCHSPQNKPELGITCTPYQRYGYDICPASTRGREILEEAYSPLFKSGIDYAQILDQNHGGGQYMCFAREHNHPPMPGEWMTTNMKELLTEWNKSAPNMLFGCESAAAEPFIPNLLMSDNRYELNYPFGTPVPIYAYIYHEYVRNFMGNQCGCPFEPACDTLRYRLAYSFSVGDIMTLIITPSGELMTHWGTHDFEHAPDMEKTLRFIRNMNRFYNESGKEYLLCGKMCNAPDIECEEIEIPMFRGRPVARLPRLLSSCWEAEGGRVAYIVVNPEDEALFFSIEGKKYELGALDAVLIVK